MNDFKKIYKNPEAFIPLNFCFTKKYKQYLFFDSVILAQNECIVLLFDFLRSLFENSKSNNADNWEFLIPFEQSGTYFFEENNRKEIVKVNKELRVLNFEELVVCFKSFNNKFLGSERRLWLQLIQTIPEFWIGKDDVVAVFASYNSELIIVAIDSISDINQTVINIEKLKPFMYDSISEYIDFYSRLFPKENQGIIKSFAQHFKQ